MARIVVVSALFCAASVAAALYVFRGNREEPPSAAVAPLHAPKSIDAAQIASGRLAMDRMPPEVGSALETYSEEIVRTAQALETKQARITGSCAPGSAIRVVAEDGTVRCQALPRGVTSVPAIAAIPRLSSTVTEAGNVQGGTGRYQTQGADDYLVVPIQLPDGALVTGFSYTFYDAAPTADSEAFLYRSDDEPLASVSSTGAEERVRTLSSDQIALHRIDAAHFSYFVYFQVSSAAGAKLMPISAAVSYRLP